MTETVIEDLGKWQFALVVTDGEVTARCGVPYDGTLYYSTRDCPNRADRNSEYQLNAREVVRRYVDESQTERDFGLLIDRVQAALGDGGRPEPTRSEPADFGGGESTGVQDL